MKSIGYRDFTHISVIKELGVEVQKALQEIVTQKDYEANEIVVAMKEEATTAFIISRGTAEVFRYNDRGERELITLIGPGDVIGLGDKKNLNKKWFRSANIISIEKMTLFEFSVKSCFELFDRFPEMEVAFKKIAKRMSYYSFIKKIFPSIAFDFPKIQKISSLLKEKSVADGEVLIRRGDVSDSCYFIFKGMVEVYQLDNGIKNVVATLNEGDIFGESALFHDVKRSAYVAALGDCTLFSIKGEEIRPLLFEHEGLSKFYGRLIEYRSCPKKIETVEECIESWNGEEKRTLLKNKMTSTYYHLSNEELAVWKQLDGKSSIDEVARRCENDFKDITKEFILKFIEDLLYRGFLENPQREILKPSVLLSMRGKIADIAKKIKTYFCNEDL